MNGRFRALLLVAVVLAVASAALGQADDICREYGEAPSRELSSTNRLVPFIYGKILIKGLAPDAKRPKVTALYSDTGQPGARQSVEKSGNYCFKKLGAGGIVMIEIDGLEVARRSVADSTSGSQREDFEIFPNQISRTAAPGVVSANPSRPQNDKTIGLYRKAAEAESGKDLDKAVDIVKEIVRIDPDDFIAWTKLGSLHLGSGRQNDSEAAFKRALELKADYVPALLSLGILKGIQSKIPDAIDLFQRAVAADPSSARGYRLLGEAYLQNRQGTKGIEALDKALALDPIGAADAHLLKARLFDLVGAKKEAAIEYKAFLSKVPDHKEKKALEQYIKTHGN